MKTKIIEAVVGQFLWCPFLVGQFDCEHDYVSVVEDLKLLRKQLPTDLLVLDLTTKEGAVFGIQGHARGDIAKHRIWSSLLFEPFLNWIREQFAGGATLDTLPSQVDLPGETATDSVRHDGPLETLLRTCLKSPDKEIRDVARIVWRASHGALPAGTPPTLADVRGWLGDLPATD